VRPLASPATLTATATPNPATPKLGMGATFSYSMQRSLVRGPQQP
jgi:hypothetical protein